MLKKSNAKRYIPALLIVGLMVALAQPVVAAVIITIPNGDFESGAPGATPDNWRSFAVAGAAGSGIIDTSNPFEGAQAALLSRSNPAGDAALDKDTPDFRIHISGGEDVIFQFAAMKISGDDNTTLNFRVAEFGEAGNWLGDRINENLTPGEGSYNVFEIPHSFTSDTRMINVAFRVAGTGAYMIDGVRTIPEPASLLLLGLGSSFLLRRKRKA